MNRAQRVATTLTATLLLLALHNNAHAIVPSLAVGPLAALGGLIAGFLVFMLSGILGALGFKTLSQRMRGQKVVVWVTWTVTTILLAALGLALYWWMGVRGLIWGAAGFAALWVVRRWGYLLRRPGAVRYGAIAAVVAVLVALGAGLGYQMGKRNATSANSASGSDVGTSTIKSWPMFRGGPARLGWLDGKPGPTTPVDAFWAVKDSKANIGDVSPSPAVVGGRVFVGGSFASVFFRGGNIYCLDEATGKILWRFQTAQQIFSSPAVADGRVYCGEGLHSDGNSCLYCIDATSGTLVWKFQTKSHVESSPAVVDGKVFFGAGEDGVFCLTADKGEVVWHFEGVHVDVGPAVDDKHVYFGTGYGVSGIFCLDRETGEKVWSKTTPYGAWGTPSVDGDDLFYSIGNGNFVESAPESQRFGRVVCSDAATGKERWHYDVPDAVLSAVAIAGDRVYFGCRDKNVYCLDRKTGKLVWKYETGGAVVSSPAVAGDIVYIGSDDGFIYALKAKTGELAWRYDTKKATGRSAPIWSSPAVADGRVFVGSSSGYIFCIGHVDRQEPSS